MVRAAQAFPPPLTTLAARRRPAATLTHGDDGGEGGDDSGGGEAAREAGRETAEVKGWRWRWHWQHGSDIKMPIKLERRCYKIFKLVQYNVLRRLSTQLSSDAAI